MSEELKRVGEILRSKRQEKNLSLKEVENATSVRQSFLAAIEEGSIADQLSSIYVQGFLKQYATFLGFEAEKFVKEHAAAFRMPPEKHEFSYGIGTLETRGSQSGGVKWLPNLLWAGLSAVILTAAWFLVKFLGIL